MNKNNGLVAWGLLIFLSIIWGSSFILIKKGLVDLSPVEVGAIRIISAMIVLLPIAIKNLKGLSRRTLKLLFVIGFVGSFCPAFLFAIAQTHLESSITGVINALTPLSVILMGFLFFAKRFGPKVIAGMFLGFVGTAILIFSGTAFSGGSVNYYALYVVLATVMYGVNLNVIKYYLAEINSMTITSISLLFVGPIALVILFFFTGFTDKIGVVDGVWLSTGYILVLGIVGTAMALLVFNHLVKITDPVFASSVTYIIPVVALIWGLIDDETLYTMHYIGIGLILFGVWVANSKMRVGKPAPAKA